MNPPSGNQLVAASAGVKADRGCRLCRLSETCQTVCLTGVGPKRAKAMIIGEAPGENEDEGGEPFIGRSGRLLTEMLAEAGIERDEVYVTNAVHCRPPNNRTPTKSEIRKCQPWIKYEIERVNPEVVLLLGNVPLQSVLGKTGIKKMRGQPIEDDGIVYLPTFHPSYVLREDRVRGQVATDLKKFRAMMDGGGMPELPGLDYRIVRSRMDVEDMLDDVAASYGMAYDLETTGLSAFHGAPVSIGVATRDRQWIILVNHYLESLPTNLVLYAVTELTKLRKPKAGHNVKFDAVFMKEHFGVDWSAEFDTMLAHYILNENSMHGLDIVANEKYGAITWDVPLTVKTGRTGTVEEHCRYLASDVMYTYKMWMDMLDELDEQPGIKKLFDELLMPAARMFIDIEHHGVFIDETKFEAAEMKLRDTIAQADFKLNALFPKTNWGSPQQVARVLFEEIGLDPLDITKGGSPSTSESVLKRLQDKHEVPGLLLKRRAASQQLSFFIEGWKPWLVDGRLHPHFKLHGTVTGRLSCSDPNLQQVPRDPVIRCLISAPPGWVLVEADLSQIELRVAAELSGDPELMRCFIEGVDVHWLTAMREIFRGQGYHDEILATVAKFKARPDGQIPLFDYDDCYELMLEMGPDKATKLGPPKTDDFPGWKEVRKRAKAINFGFLFGMWWKKFKDYARDNYDVIVTDEEAQQSRISFFELYTRLPKWHNKQRTFANRNGYVRSLFGRKRRLPAAKSGDDTMAKQEAERQAINSPVQSFASDLNIAAALELSGRHSSEYFHIVGAVHDAILMEVRLDKVKFVVDDVLRTMSHPALMDDFNIELRVPIEAEAKIGPWSLGISPEEYYAKHNIV